MKIRFNIKIIYILLVLFIVSCTKREQNDKGYLPGIYTYELRTELFQKLEINKDYTFKQTLYYEKDGEILYENYGKMYVDGIKITLENWLECYENEDGRYILRAEPYTTTVIGPTWLKYKDSEEVSIVIFDEPDYIFKKELN